MNIAIEFNNVGTGFFKSSDLDEAWDMFKGSFDTMTIVRRNDGSVPNDADIGHDAFSENEYIQRANALLLQQQQQDWGDSSTMLSSRFSEMVSISDTLFSAEEEESVAETVTSINDQQKDPFVYRKPLNLQEQDIVAIPVKQATAAAVVVLYNLALVGHLRCVDGSDDRKVLENKVLKLYEMALGMLQQIMDEEASLAYLRMALLNNMGQIHHELCQYQIARRFLDDLFDTVEIVLYEDTVENCGAGRIIAEESYSLEEFLFNSLLLQPPSATPAA